MGDQGLEEERREDRLMIAALAMQGLLAGVYHEGAAGQAAAITGCDNKTKGATPEVLAEMAVEHADALLKELERTEKRE